MGYYLPAKTRKSRFVEMFGGWGNPLSLPICKVGDVINAIDPHPSHRTPPVVANGIPYVGVAECDREAGIIRFDKARRVSVDVLRDHRSRYRIQSGDFLIGKIGTIGKPFFLPEDLDYVLSANTVLIQPIRERVSPAFLKVQFENRYIEHQIMRNAKSTSQPAFGMNKVRDLDMLNPPLALQREFAAFVAEVDKSEFAVRKSLEELQKLYRQQMQEAFG